MRRYWGCLLPELINNSPIEHTDMSCHLSKEELDKVGLANSRIKIKKKNGNYKKIHTVNFLFN